VSDVIRPHTSLRTLSMPLALLVLGVALIALYQVSALLNASYAPGTLLRGTLALAYMVAGTLAWRRRPDYLTGRIMLLAGFLALVPVLQRIGGVSAAYAVGNTFGGLHLAVLAYLILTYPSGRAGPGLNGAVARIVVVSALLLSLADLLTRQTGGPSCPTLCGREPNPFLLVDLGTIVAETTSLLVGVLAVLVLVLVVRRFLLAAGAARRSLAPVLVAGALAAGLSALQYVTFVANSLGVAFADSTLFDFGSGIAQVLIPVALGVGFLRSRMARAGVADLVLRAGPAPTVGELQAAVRRTLHDPSVRLGRWSENSREYLDVDGSAIDNTHAGSQETTLIAGSRGPLAVLTHDPILSEEGDLLPSVAAAVRIVLENETLSTSLQAQAADARNLPAGRVTLIKTDVEGSTELLDSIPDDYPRLLADLRRIIRARVRQAEGVEIDSRADEFFGAISDPVAAVDAAVGIQRELAAQQWPAGAKVRVRIGLHTGEPARTDEGYVGMDVHLCARVADAGHGGQIVLSDATRAAVAGRLPPGLPVRDLGSYRLKGIPLDIRLHAVVVPGSDDSFAPLRAELVASPAGGD
jgi:class 3 adenylate cyclase